MKNDILYNSFLEEITKKIPQKMEIVNILATILSIGKDDVYKRLKGETPFTFYETILISRRLGISLDKLNTEISATSKPFKMDIIEYINPAESNFALIEEIISILKLVKDMPEAKGGEITNILPQPLFVAYENISKFYLFKWKYQFNKLHKVMSYKDVTITNKFQKIQEENVKWAKHLHTDYIFDNQLFQSLVTNIKYFYYVGLITGEEVRLIKQDLLRILDDINILSRTGFFKETKKKVNIYISNVNVDTGYCYIEAADYQLMIIKAFLLNGVASTDKEAFEGLKRWMQSIKRQSTLITGSDEKERIDFLEEQHNVIEGLSQL